MPLLLLTLLGKKTSRGNKGIFRRDMPFLSPGGAVYMLHPSSISFGGRRSRAAGCVLLDGPRTHQSLAKWSSLIDCYKHTKLVTR